MENINIQYGFDLVESASSLTQGMRRGSHIEGNRMAFYS